MVLQKTLINLYLKNISKNLGTMKCGNSDLIIGLLTSNARWEYLNWHGYINLLTRDVRSRRFILKPLMVIVDLKFLESSQTVKAVGIFTRCGSLVLN